MEETITSLILLDRINMVFLLEVLILLKDKSLFWSSVLVKGFIFSDLEGYLWYTVEASKLLINVIELFNFIYSFFFCVHTKVCICKGIYTATWYMLYDKCVSMEQGWKAFTFLLYNLVIFKFLQVYIFLIKKNKRH